MRFSLLPAVIGSFFIAVSAWGAPARKAAKTPAKPAVSKVAKAPKAGHPVTLELAHRLTAGEARGMERIVQQFNQRSPDVQVVMTPFTTGSALAPLNLLDRESVANIPSAKFRPLSQVMRAAGVLLNAKVIADDLKHGLTDRAGQLSALPVAFSMPVLFINQDLFRLAGLNPDKAPRTWREVQQAADTLIDKRVRCPYTSSWPVWIMVDNLNALHGHPVSGKKNDLSFNGLTQIKFVAMLITWYKSQFFRDFGSRNEADQHFLAGECAMLTSASSLWSSFVGQGAPAFKASISALPFFDDIQGAPRNVLADGASLWVRAGLNTAETKAAGRFVKFLMESTTQQELASLGFLPLTTAARTHAGALGRIANLQLKGSHPAFRVANHPQTHRITAEELNAAWSAKKSAKAAVDSAVSRGNAALIPKKAPTPAKKTVKKSR